jgi:chaperonin GroES
VLYQAFKTKSCQSPAECAKTNRVGDATLSDSACLIIAFGRETIQLFKSVEVQSMDIRPLHDRIVVKRIEEKEVKAGSLYIPDSAKEKPQEGEVVAVGKGKRNDEGKLIPLDVQVGDRILFGKYSGSDIKIDGTEYMIMREDEVLGVLQNVSVGAKA